MCVRERERDPSVMVRLAAYSWVIMLRASREEQPRTSSLSSLTFGTTTQEEEEEEERRQVSFSFSFSFFFFDIRSGAGGMLSS